MSEKDGDKNTGLDMDPDENNREKGLLWAKSLFDVWANRPPKAQFEMATQQERYDPSVLQSVEYYAGEGPVHRSTIPPSPTTLLTTSGPKTLWEAVR